MKISALIFLFTITVSFVSASSFLEDSLIASVETEADLNIKVQSLSYLAFYYLGGSVKEKGMHYLQRAIDEAVQGQQAQAKGLQSYKAGLIAWDEKKVESAEMLLRRGLDQLDSVGTEMHIFSALSNIRLFFNAFGLHDKKFKFYRERLTYYRSNGPEGNMGSCYHGIANYYLFMGNYEQAITNYILAGEEMFKLDYFSGYNISNHVVGGIYADWGNMDKSEELISKMEAYTGLMPSNVFAMYKLGLVNVYISQEKYDEALVICNELKLKSKELLPLQSISRLIFEAEIAFQRNMLEDGINYIDTAEHLSKGSGLGIWNSTGNLEIDYYRYKYNKGTGNLDSARYFLSLALQKAQAVGFKPLEGKYLREISELYLAMQDSVGALKYTLEYQALSDSISATQNLKRMQAFETKLADDKEQTILAQQIEEKDRKNLIQISAILILVLLLGSLIALSGRVAMKPAFAEGLIFIFFILLFEFVLVVLDPWVDDWSGGLVGIKLGINSIFALAIFAGHHFFEGKLTKMVMTKQA